MGVVSKGTQSGPTFGGVVGGISDILNIGSNISNLFGRRKQWEREDTAYQRKVKDLEAAGLNKVLAVQGSGSPSSPMMVGGSRVGGAADASLKNVTSMLQREQTKAAGWNTKTAETNSYTAGSNQSIAYDRAYESRQWHNALSAGRNNFSTMIDIQRGNLENEKIKVDTANRFQIPVEMLGSAPGQTLMLGQMLDAMSEKDQRKFLTRMALSSVVGSAGNVVSRFTSNLK